MREDPFTVLGLPVRADLTDDDVRASWRRIAAATHPDREDGGDPAQFGAAAAAYALLRTSFGRGEALADLRASGYARRSHRRSRRRRARPPAPSLIRLPVRPWPPFGVRPPAPSPVRPRGRGAGRGAHRARAHLAVHLAVARYLPVPATAGRPLALRAGGAAVAAGVTVAAVGWTPATIGLVTGALTVTGWGLWRQRGWDQ